MSLRTRLVLGALCALALALVTADLLVYRAMRQQLIERLDLSRRDARLPFGPSRGDRGNKGGTADGPRGDDSVFVRVRSAVEGSERSVPATLADGTTASPRLPLVVDTPAPTNDPDGAAAFFEAPSVEPGGPRSRVKASRFASGDELVVSAPLTDVTDTLRRLRVAEAGVSAAALVTGGSIALLLVTLALRPLRRVEAAAGAVAGGDLARRAALPPGRSEVAQLGTTFDTMVDRLTDALDERAKTEERLRRFVADGAHELRTPIAAVSAYAELIERGASERPADLARAVRGIRAKSARLAFERFWRADTSRARASGGAGLGLAIVAAIVEGQGGTASIDHTVAAGTTVVLDLPVRETDS